jgi:hypothetical protein
MPTYACEALKHCGTDQGLGSLVLALEMAVCCVHRYSCPHGQAYQSAAASRRGEEMKGEGSRKNLKLR